MFEPNDIPCISMKGWLLKWTNMVKGYRRRWFVLANGNLSYYREKTEFAHGQRGTINLLNALMHSFDSSSFVISRFDSKEVFYMKASNSMERQKWVTALEIAKLWAINEAYKENNNVLDWIPDYNSYQREVSFNLTILGTQIESIQKVNNTITQNGTSLKTKLHEYYLTDKSGKISALNALCQLLKTNSRSFENLCMSYIELAANHNKISKYLLNAGVQSRIHLQGLVVRLEALQSLLQKIIKDKNIGKSQQTLEKIIQRDLLRRRNSSLHNRASRQLDENILQSTHGQRTSILSTDTNDLSISLDESASLQMMMPEDYDVTTSRPTLVTRSSFCSYSSKVYKKSSKRRRNRIPDKPNYPLNLWSILKNCIGKDLSKIPMPVNFSEPLSLLQRIAEDFTYSDVLDRAAESKDPLEELAYLAAFAISCYATTVNRTAKPFNPLLGETFEWDRTEDLGWRLISEQVSHHPPICAQFCEGREWTCWQECSMSSKFRGKYITIVPLGISHIIFHSSNNHYSWNKVTTTVNNIILGKLWVDNTGEMNIISHRNSVKCHVEFFPYSMFRSEERKVIGEVYDNNNEVKWIIKGKWDTEVTIAPVIKKTGKAANPDYITGPPTIAWKLNPLPEDSHKYYHFSEFACQLNEMEAGISPTDSRNRPDQRLMEEGKWDEANISKTILEDKQRQIAKRRAEETVINSDLESSNVQVINAHVYQPKWFKTELDNVTGRITYKYEGGYWEAKSKQQWENSPEIFTILD